MENGHDCEERQLMLLEAAAARGIECARSAKCNAFQCQVLSTVFHRLHIFTVRWRLCFRDEFSNPELGLLLGVLVATVQSACQLMDQYDEQRWLQTVIFTLENELGFLAAAKDIDRHVKAVLNSIDATTPEKMTLLQQIRQVQEIEAACAQDLLQRAGKQDRKELERRAQQTDRVSPLHLFRGAFALNAFRLGAMAVVKKKLAGDIPPIIPSRELQKQLRLGEGAFGVVYKATWLGKLPVAIKAFKGTDPLDREIRIMAGLPYHPNVVQILGSMEPPTEFIMQLMAMNLGTFLKDKGKPTLPHALDMILQIARAMLFLHQNDVCYRDLKPGNILLSEDATHLKLADFGHSKAQFNSQQEDHTGRIGTPMYMAPEVLKLPDTGRYDRKADVYSFAICCSEILTGTSFTLSVRNMDERFQMVERGDRPGLPEDLPPRLTQLIEQCWKLDPGERPCFESIVTKLWEIRESVITGRMSCPTSTSNGSAHALQSSTSGDDSSSVFHDEIRSLETEIQGFVLRGTEEITRVPDPEELASTVRVPEIQGLAIRGDKVVGSRLIASWTFNNTSSCIVQWMRSSDGAPSTLVGKQQHLSSTSSEYLLTPDDLNFHIGIRCVPVDNELLHPGVPISVRCDTPVSRDTISNEEFNKCSREQFAEFNVKIDREHLPGSKFRMHAENYQLWWHLSSRKNFRVSYEQGIHLTDNPLACTLKNNKGREYTLKFSDTRKRDLAVMLWRHFAEAAEQRLRS